MPFKVAQDNVWKGHDVGISAKNHHLADLAHHPTPAGLMASLVVQFLRIGTFVNKDGEWHFFIVETHLKDIKEILIPAVVTGILNWMAFVAEKELNDHGLEIPRSLRHIIHLLASTPLLLEVVKCCRQLVWTFGKRYGRLQEYGWQLHGDTRYSNFPSLRGCQAFLC